VCVVGVWVCEWGVCVGVGVWGGWVWVCVWGCVWGGVGVCVCVGFVMCVRFGNMYTVLRLGFFLP